MLSWSGTVDTATWGVARNTAGARLAAAAAAVQKDADAAAAAGGTLRFGALLLQDSAAGALRVGSAGALQAAENAAQISTCAVTFALRGSGKHTCNYIPSSTWPCLSACSRWARPLLQRHLAAARARHRVAGRSAAARRSPVSRSLCWSPPAAERPHGWSLRGRDQARTAAWGGPQLQAPPWASPAAAKEALGLTGPVSLAALAAPAIATARALRLLRRRPPCLTRCHCR